MAIQTRIVNNLHTEIYVGGGNFITQSKPTNFHQFYTRKILTANEHIEDFKEVTETEKTALEQSDAAWTRPPQSFIDEWAVAAGTAGCYNEETGYFELNGLTDITMPQMLTILLDSGGRAVGPSVMAHSKARTNLPLRATLGPSLSSAFIYCTSIEVIKLESYYGLGKPMAVNNLNHAFSVCYKLRVIDAILQVGSSDTSFAFDNCNMLEEVRLKSLAKSLGLKRAGKLSLDSIKYMVENATNTSAITITLHPQAYARVTDEIFALAASKDITIATT